MKTLFSAEVQNVTFENEETGFRVLKVSNLRVSEGPNSLKGESSLTVVGVMPRVGKGLSIRVAGVLGQHPKHGAQVQVESVVALVPSGQEALESYLGSGVVSGLGPGFAKRVVRYFGESTLSVLDHEGHRLLEVPGLGKKRAEEIRAAWVEHRNLSNLLLALGGFGVSHQLAKRVVEVFGQEAAEVVQKRPYDLALKVRGIGFQTADQIAQKSGISKEHPERLMAGLVHELRVFSEGGHTRCAESLLLERASQRLEVPQALLDSACSELIRRKFIVYQAGQFALRRLAEAEEGVAERVAELLGAPGKGVVGLDAKLRAFQERVGFELAAGQREAIEMAMQEKLGVITGGPGVGKTTIIAAIVELLRAEGRRVKLAAPTGRAAKRLREGANYAAETIHRLLEVAGHTGNYKRNRENPIEADILIVDESSMIDIQLALDLLLAVPDACRVLFVGDIDQLPSVGPGAFLADLMGSQRVVVKRLEAVFRQSEQSQIVANAHRVLQGELPIGSRNPEGEFFVIEVRDQAHAAELIGEIVQKRAPTRFSVDPLTEVQVLTPMHRGAAGTIELNLRLQALLNPSGEEIRFADSLYRRGDKVMQTRNDYDKGVVNGDAGVISFVDAEAQTLKVRFDDGSTSEEVVYEQEELGQLSHAYAMSIHKSQGSEYPVVVMPILNAHHVMLSRNLLYTGLTRAQRVCVLLTQNRALSSAVLEVRKEERTTGLLRLLTESKSSSPQ